MAAYIRALVGGSIVVATLCSAGFSLIGVSYPILFGVAAGLLEFLPLVGPFIIAVLVVAVTALQSLSGAAIVAGFLLVVRLLEDYAIYPRLVGRELPLHPMAVILAILCGAEIGGVAGVFLAVPTLAVLTVAYRHWRAHRAEESPGRPPSETVSALPIPPSDAGVATGPPGAPVARRLQPTFESEKEQEKRRTPCAKNDRTILRRRSSRACPRRLREWTRRRRWPPPATKTRRSRRSPRERRRVSGSTGENRSGPAASRRTRTATTSPRATRGCRTECGAGCLGRAIRPRGRNVRLAEGRRSRSPGGRSGGSDRTEAAFEKRQGLSGENEDEES